MSSISEDSYFTFEQAVDDWNTSHKDKFLSPETAKTLNLGKEIFVQFNEKTGFRITERSFWSRFQDQGLNIKAKSQLDLWKVLPKRHYHAYTVLTNPFAPSAEKEQVLSNALKYCETIPPSIPQKERMIFLDLMVRKYIKSQSADIGEDFKDIREDFIRAFTFLFSSPTAEEFKALLPRLREVLYQAKSKINNDRIIFAFETKLASLNIELRSIELRFPEVKKILDSLPRFISRSEPEILYNRSLSENFITAFKLLWNQPSKEDFKTLLPFLKDALYKEKSKISSDTDISYITAIAKFELELDALIRRNVKTHMNVEELACKRIFNETLDASPLLIGDIDSALEGFPVTRACQSIQDRLASFKETRTSEEEQKQIQQLTEKIAFAKETADAEVLAYKKILSEEGMFAAVTKIDESIQNLQTKIPPYIILLGGFSRHAILYKIAWDSATKSHRISVINTGAGARMTRFSVAGRLKHTKVTNVEYANIPIEKLNSDFIKKFVLLQREFSTDQALIKSIDVHFGTANKTSGKEHMAQYRGTCPVACQLAWLREEMDPKLYAEFEVFMAERNLALLDEEIKTMSHEKFKLIFPEVENQEEILTKLRGAVVYSLEERQRRLKEGITEDFEIKRLSEDSF